MEGESDALSMTRQLFLKRQCLFSIFSFAFNFSVRPLFFSFKPIYHISTNGKSGGCHQELQISSAKSTHGIHLSKHHISSGATSLTGPSADLFWLSDYTVADTNHFGARWLKAKQSVFFFFSFIHSFFFCFVFFKASNCKNDGLSLGLFCVTSSTTTSGSRVWK